MATVKIKFRPSTVDGGQGVIFYQVIHNRVARQHKTGYRLYGYEWNNHLSEIVLPKFNESRKRYLSEIGDKIRMDIKFFQKIISSFEHSGCDYTADDVIAEFVTDNQENYLFSFMGGVISNLQTWIRGNCCKLCVRSLPIYVYRTGTIPLYISRSIRS